MTKLTIVANIHANPAQIDLVKGELEKLVSITRAKKGCLQYDLHRDNSNPAHFMFLKTGRLASCGRPTWARLIGPST
jgi:quinol monooxygenase YgiN